MYIVRHTLMASSLKEAVKLSKQREPDEVWISDDWKEGKMARLESAIGFDNGVYADES